MEDSLPFAQLIINQNGIVQAANEHAAALFHMPADRLQGTPFEKWVTLHNPPVWHSLYDKTTLWGRVASLNGTAGDICWTLVPQADRCISIYGVETPRKPENPFESWLHTQALEMSQSGVLIADALHPDQPIIYANHAFENITGYRRDEVIGRNCRFLHRDESDQHGLKELRTALREHRSCHVVLKNFRKDGTPFWNELQLNPIIGHQGIVTHFVGVLHDITERQHLQSEYMEKARQYRAVSELSSDYTFSMKVNRDGTLTREFTTDAFLRVTGYTPDESEQNGGWAKLAHPDDLPLIVSTLRQLLTRPMSTSIEYRIITKSGEIRYIEGSNRSEWDDTENRCVRIYGTARDITDRKRTETRLQESEAILRAVFEHSQTAIMIANDEMRYVEANRRACEILDMSMEEILENHVIDVSLVGEENTRRIWDQFIRDGFMEGEYLLKRRDGGERIVEFRAVANVLPGRHASFIRDITGQRRAEEALRTTLEHLEQRVEERTAQLASANRHLESLVELKSRFVSVVSHEFRTPLATILSAANMLHGYYDRMERPQIEDYVNRIRSQVGLMNEIMNDTLFITKNPGDGLPYLPVETDLYALCLTLIEEVGQAFHGIGRIQFECHCDDTCRRVSLDVVLVRQILSNLLSNALKYSPTNIPVELHTYIQDQEVIFSVIDHGVGISHDDQQNLFQAFYRGSNVGNIPGTGLGLLIVKQAVDAHRGHIIFESEPGNGTSFTVFLPLEIPE